MKSDKDKAAPELPVEMRLDISEASFRRLLEHVTRAAGEAASFAGQRDYFQDLLRQGRDEISRLVALIGEKDRAIAALEARIGPEPKPDVAGETPTNA